MNKKSDPLENIISEIFKLLLSFFKSMFYGIKKLNRISSLILFIACIGVVAVIQILSLKDNIFTMLGEQTPIYMKYIVLYVLQLLPLLYLAILGQMQSVANKKYDEIFKDIGFVGKDGKYPFLINVRNDGKKKIYLFKSNIPLDDWESKKNYLETGLDCNILLLKEGKNKKLTELVTVPSSCRIPEKIEWQDGLTVEKDGIITIGESALEKITFDLNKTPHVLVAGETGSGKSVILRTIVRQAALKGDKIFMIDFKGGVEFGIDYEKFGEVVMDRKRALEIFNMLVEENEKRLTLFRNLRVKNLREYNEKKEEKLCRIAVVSDEVGEMLDKKGAGKEEKLIFEQIEKAISSLARLSRATGINLFLGVQRPDANVLTGQIKNNIPIRVCGRFADKPASEIVLGNTDATGLPDIKGRFLYKLGNDTTVFQAYYFDDDTMLTDVFVEQGTMLIGERKYSPSTKEKKQEVSKTDELKSAAPTVEDEEEEEGFKFDFDFK